MTNKTLVFGLAGLSLVLILFMVFVEQHSVEALKSEIKNAKSDLQQQQQQQQQQQKTPSSKTMARFINYGHQPVRQGGALDTAARALKSLKQAKLANTARSASARKLGKSHSSLKRIQRSSCLAGDDCSDQEILDSSSNKNSQNLDSHISSKELNAMKSTDRNKEEQANLEEKTSDEETRLKSDFGSRVDFHEPGLEFKGGFEFGKLKSIGNKLIQKDKQQLESTKSSLDQSQSEARNVGSLPNIFSSLPSLSDKQESLDNKEEKQLLPSDIRESFTDQAGEGDSFLTGPSNFIKKLAKDHRKFDDSLEEGINKGVEKLFDDHEKFDQAITEGLLKIVEFPARMLGGASLIQNSKNSENTKDNKKEKKEEEDGRAVEEDKKGEKVSKSSQRSGGLISDLSGAIQNGIKEVAKDHAKFDKTTEKSTLKLVDQSFKDNAKFDKAVTKGLMAAAEIPEKLGAPASVTEKLQGGIKDVADKHEQFDDTAKQITKGVVEKAFDDNEKFDKHVTEALLGVTDPNKDPKSLLELPKIDLQNNPELNLNISPQDSSDGSEASAEDPDQEEPEKDDKPKGIGEIIGNGVALNNKIIGDSIGFGTKVAEKAVDLAVDHGHDLGELKEKAIEDVNELKQDFAEKFNENAELADGIIEDVSDKLQHKKANKIKPLPIPKIPTKPPKKPKKMKTPKPKPEPEPDYDQTTPKPYQMPEPSPTLKPLPSKTSYDKYYPIKPYPPAYNPAGYPSKPVSYKTNYNKPDYYKASSVKDYNNYNSYTKSPYPTSSYTNSPYYPGVSYANANYAAPVAKVPSQSYPISSNNYGYNYETTTNNPDSIKSKCPKLVKILKALLKKILKLLNSIFDLLESKNAPDNILDKLDRVGAQAGILLEALESEYWKIIEQQTPSLIKQLLKVAKLKPLSKIEPSFKPLVIKLKVVYTKFQSQCKY